MRASYRGAESKDGKPITVHNGHYAPVTAIDRAAQKVEEDYEDRVDELRLKATFALGKIEEISKIALLSATITQVGKEGFYWKLPGEPIPTFQRWNRATLLENERIFNGRT